MQTVMKAKPRTSNLELRTCTYDLSSFPAPEVGQLREAAQVLRARGIALDRMFWTPDGEVNLGHVEAKCDEIVKLANMARALARKFQGKQQV